MIFFYNSYSHVDLKNNAARQQTLIDEALESTNEIEVTILFIITSKTFDLSGYAFGQEKR